MKNTGIIRRLDSLGRITIPREILKLFKVGYGDSFDVYTEKDKIILKLRPSLNFNGLANVVASSLSDVTERTAIICNSEFILATAGKNAEKFTAKSLSEKARRLISDGIPVVVRSSDGDQPFEITEGNSYGFKNQLLLPVETNGETVGAIILGETDKNLPISDLDLKVTRLSALYLANEF